MIEPYVLPHQDDFSSGDAFRLASGPANWNQQQGFYIYRAGRMIQSGGWSNLRAPDEHTKLARIAVSFSPALDEAFKINVAKMRVQMPSTIRDAVRDAIGPVVKLAREIYDRKPAWSPISAPRPSGAPTDQPASGNGTSGEATAVSYPAPTGYANNSSSASSRVEEAEISKSSSLLTLEDWTHRTLEVATEDERPVIKKVLERLQN